MALINSTNASSERLLSASQRYVLSAPLQPHFRTVLPRLMLAGVGMSAYRVAHARVCHTATQPASGMLRDPFRGEAQHCRNLFDQLAADHALDLAAD